jgi:prolipoprotein diacylglyceryltransferase
MMNVSRDYFQLCFATFWPKSFTYILLHYVIWDINPVLLRLGAFEIRWYGLLFALGFLLGRQLWYHFLKEEGKPVNDLDALLLHTMLGTIVGARLGQALRPLHNLPRFSLPLEEAHFLGV